MSNISGTYVVGQPRNNNSQSIFSINVSERVKKFVKGEGGQGGSAKWTTEFLTVKVFSGNKQLLEIAQSLQPGDTVEVHGELESDPYERTDQSGAKILSAGLTVVAYKLKRPEFSREAKGKLGIPENGTGNGGGQQQQPQYQQAPQQYQQPGPQPGYQQPAPPQYQQPAPPPGYQQAPPQPGYQPPPQHHAYQQPAQQPGYQQPPPQQQAPPPQQQQQYQAPPQQAPPVDYGGDDFDTLGMPPAQGQ